MLRVEGGRRASALAWFAAAFLLLVGLVGVEQLLNDADTYWHVTVGRDIAASGSLPVVDTYSWTMAGEPWIAKEWLSQLLYAGAFELAGWPGVALLAASAAACAVGMLARFLAARLDVVATGALLAAAFLLAAPHLLARPHVLAWPVMVAWVVLLVRGVDGSSAPPWPALVLLLLWANLHGSFLLGLAVAAGLAVDAVVGAAPGASRRRRATQWGSFLLAAGATVLVTPYGVGTVAAALDVLRLRSALDILVEWRAADLGSPGGYELMLLAGAVLLLLGGRRLGWPRALVVGALLWLAFTAVRNGSVLGLLAPILVATPLAARRGRPVGAEPAPRWSAAAAGTAVLAGVLAVVTLQRADLVPAPVRSPQAAVDVLRDTGTTRLLNDYAFGGFLVNAGVPTYVDGRTELFGEDRLRSYDRAVRASPPAALTALLEADRIEATLLRPGAPAVASLDAAAEWERLYTDDLAVIHVRVASTDG